MSYSLAEAASACGVNRSTLLRAIKSGRISGSRDEQGAWAVEPVELHRVFPPMPAEVAPRAVPQDAQADAQVAALLAQLAEMRERLSDRDERLSETRADRDAWREQAQRLALTPPKPQTWWSWLRTTA